ncbi:phosphoglycerate kinase [Halobacteriales archaeon QS_1_68_20]|nr:MAG: phosphoglycerate kinase [Halobacteriales archaeon QS_1_68_20]
MSVRTLDDLAVDGKRVAVRVDVNSPLSPDGSIADDARLRAHVDTVSELCDRGERVAILAHQGRPGGDEFAPLSGHADRLDELVDAPVGYEDCTFSTCARERVQSLDRGEAVVLENTRFYSEEYMEFEPEAAAETYLVEKLVPALDVYVNDAFAAAHRSQPSLVGFPQRLPAYAGRVMERELDVLGTVDETPRPRVFVLGGAKVPDSLDVAESVLRDGVADEVLTCGVVGNVFLIADGVDLGDATTEFIYDQGYWDQVDRAADLLDAYGDDVRMPRDVAVERDGERTELGLVRTFEEGEAALDVGSKTVEHYARIVDEAETVILNGPAGVFEREAFAHGTRGIYGVAADDADYSIVGGGDTAAALRDLGIDGFDHVSTGGGACLQMLTGEPLAAVEALEQT